MQSKNTDKPQEVSVQITTDLIYGHLSPTYSVIVVRFCFCILHPEILILPTTPESFYFIVIIRICIRLKPEKNNKKSIFSLKNII